MPIGADSAQKDLNGLSSASDESTQATSRLELASEEIDMHLHVAV